MTVHASKGLEYPIVYLPFAFNAQFFNTDGALLFHDEDDARRLHIGAKTADRAAGGAALPTGAAQATSG